MRPETSRRSPIHPRRPWARAILVVLGLFLFTFWPVLSILLVSAVAKATGCSVDESQVHPCLVAGLDLGPALYTLGVLGWCTLLTVPLGLSVAITTVVRFLRVRRRPGAA